MQMRDPELETSGKIIGFYPREFYFLDNFSAFQVELDGIVFPTSEHAYHYIKFKGFDDGISETILQCRSPHDAQKVAYANKDKQDPDWDSKKVEVMKSICRAKFTQHEYVRAKLKGSGELEIVEDSTKDPFWGWGPNRDGRNELGKIWMEIRDLSASSR